MTLKELIEGLRSNGHSSPRVLEMMLHTYGEFELVNSMMSRPKPQPDRLVPERGAEGDPGKLVFVCGPVPSAISTNKLIEEALREERAFLAKVIRSLIVNRVMNSATFDLFLELAQRLDGRGE